MLLIIAYLVFGGFRGETKELWQMEGRVKRDIWYIENWSIWLTAKTVFIHDKNAY